ncbi:MAG: HAMP domain-containing histidine kinase [Burkholderiales bacterium]|uniref:ATP-binding protein n=1 Tax=Inhella sp. TaxID=1921806 RepID=UPI001AC2281A|nr:HAMP domain-containing histidine kinase [Burkholderiales bacterium]
MSSGLPPTAAVEPPTVPVEPAGRAGSPVRLFRTFLMARAGLGVALAAAQIAAQVLGNQSPRLGLMLCLGYALLTLVQWVWPVVEATELRWLRAKAWWATVGLDILLFSALAAVESPSNLPVAAMLVLPVLLSAVMASRRAGLAAASMATLGLLGASFYAGLVAAEWGSSITQGGLAGIGYFAVALLGSELAARLVREQAVAQGSMAYARQQVALNQLVIDEMKEGVLVLDRELVVRAANPAALALLGEREPARQPPFSLEGVSAWAALREAAREAWRSELGEASGEPLAPTSSRVRDVMLAFVHAPARALRLRVRAMPGRSLGEADDLLLLLLEDRATLLARARQDKLAAMGRMSAGIAHEIRNPLAAISQANALLGEDLGGQPAHQRLTALVASNVQRLQRIVDEVMLLAAPAQGEAVSLDGTAMLQEICDDWLRTQTAAQLDLALPDVPVSLRFEPDHLRRVVLNLLDNAWRHAQCEPKPWVRLELLPGDPPRCRVLNPSPPLPTEVERHLFEPFFSTRSRGSGLGLYICRELCERYGARIDYRSDTEQGAVVFTLSFQAVHER